MKKPKYMKKYSLFLLLLLLAGCLLFAAVLSPARHDKRKGFAVVELFTSEGCSSCPPADKALAELAAKYPDNVFVLGFHVDYWDRLGWKDIYSGAQYTQRQKDYAQLFKLESIYTPEAVVNGSH